MKNGRFSYTEFATFYRVKRHLRTINNFEGVAVWWGIKQKYFIDACPRLSIFIGEQNTINLLTS
jgi:hypothetical protein